MIKIASCLGVFTLLALVVSSCSGSDSTAIPQTDASVDAPSLFDAGDGGEAAAPCPKGLMRCGDKCLDLESDNQHCGACDAVCPQGRECSHGTCVVVCAPDQTACDGRCTVVDTDVQNCGACGNVCPGGKVCSHGKCTASCDTDLVSCGDHCAAVKTDPNNCGTCNNKCPSAANSVAACVNGACSIVCNSHYGDCNGNVSDGCEANFNTDINHCGSCSGSCGKTGVASESCAAGVCTVNSCNAGYGDCDQNAQNGCETITNTVDHCGSCAPCPSHPHMTASYCYSYYPPAYCNYYCSTGFGDCNYNQADGCETDLTVGPTNCGYCGHTCGTNQQCNAGTCACVSGTTQCTNGCADLTSDIANCGTCNNHCFFANETGFSCSSSACQAGTCNTDWDNCDANAANGCEAHLKTDANHCGTCGNACASGQACVNGTCTTASACVAISAPKVLVYHAIVGDLANDLPAGSAITVANDTLWTSYTTTDFAKYDLIVIESGQYSPSTDFESAYATRNQWSPAVTGRIVVNGLENGTYSGSFATVRHNAYVWLTSGLGTALYVGSDIGSRNLDFMVNFGSFTSTSFYSNGANVRISSPSHPVMSGVNEAGLSGYVYYASTITAPSAFEVLAVNAGATNVPRLVARDVACAPK